MNPNEASDRNRYTLKTDTQDDVGILLNLPDYSAQFVTGLSRQIVSA
jgi:hypothetical protein